MFCESQTDLMSDGVDEDGDEYGNEPELVRRPSESHTRPQSQSRVFARSGSCRRLRPFPSCTRTRNCRTSVIKN